MKNKRDAFRMYMAAALGPVLQRAYATYNWDELDTASRRNLAIEAAAIAFECLIAEKEEWEYEDEDEAEETT